MQGIDIPKICKNVTDFFKASVSSIDEKVLFSKRKSKIDANLFVETLMAGCLSDPTISLEGLCKLLKKRKVTITKQGLHQRFNDEATELMKALFNQSLIQFKTENINVFNLLNQFRGLHIIDSSGVSLPSLLKDIYTRIRSFSARQLKKSSVRLPFYKLMIALAPFDQDPDRTYALLMIDLAMILP